MTLQKMDHVNVRTGNLDAMVKWYGEILGLIPGWRPPFGFPGAWLYLGDQPYVHLVGLKDGPDTKDPRLEHFAFSATDMSGFLSKLEANNVPYTVDPVPGIEIVQVNIADCDGNHIHVDFNAAEYEAMKAG